MAILKKINNFIARTRTSYLINTCFIFSFLCILVTYATGKYTGIPIRDSLIPLTYFFWGLASIPILVRQDADFGAIRFEGWLSIVIGLLLAVSGFGLFLMDFLKLLLR